MFTTMAYGVLGYNVVFVELCAKELEWPSGHSFVLKKN